MMMSYSLSLRNKNKSYLLRKLKSEEVKELIQNNKSIKNKKKVTWAKGVKSPRPSRVKYHKYLLSKITI